MAGNILAGSFFHRLIVQEAFIKLLYLIALTGVSYALAYSAYGEPYSSSCEIALEKVEKARKALVPFRRTIELARAREQGAYRELAICSGGGIFSADKALRCNEWQGNLAADQ